jgi:hypothetical protein
VFVASEVTATADADGGGSAPVRTEVAPLVAVDSGGSVVVDAA